MLNSFSVSPILPCPVYPQSMPCLLQVRAPFTPSQCPICPVLGSVFAQSVPCLYRVSTLFAAVWVPFTPGLCPLQYMRHLQLISAPLTRWSMSCLCLGGLLQYITSALRI